jgi:molybdopterin-guanine dinucleotide biosynthesis protein A
MPESPDARNESIVESIVGAVLVGGASRRMGRDKARLPFGGRSLAAHVAGVLDQVFTEVVLVARAAAEAGKRAGDGELVGRAVLTDHFPGAGPLAGLHAALLHARETRGRGSLPGGGAVFLAACDLPGLSPELVRHVTAGAPGEAGSEETAEPAWARVPVADGRLQPLAALYGPGCLSLAAENLRRGRRSMHGLLDQLTVLPVPVTPDLPFFHPDLLINVNSPEDYRLLVSEGLARPGASDTRRSS